MGAFAEAGASAGAATPFVAGASPLLIVIACQRRRSESEEGLLEELCSCVARSEGEAALPG